MSVIRTESEGQAKDIMEIMSDADAVLVAGGDGTVMEVLTGLLRRPDKAEAAKIPIGILPVGKTNTLAYRLFGHDDNVRLMGEATMSVIRDLKKPHGVIEVENRSEDETFRGKKLYCVNRVELGAWKDARLRTDKYWLFGFGLKNYITYLGSYSTGQKDVSWDCDVNIQYTEDNCDLISEVVSDNSKITNQNRGWFSWLLGKSKVKEEKTEKPVIPSKWVDVGRLNGTQIVVENYQNKLSALMYAGSIDFINFVSHGWNLWKHKLEYQNKIPNLENINHSLVTTSEILLEPNKKDTEENFKPQRLCMDGDEVDFSGPVVLRHLQNQFIVFCNKSEAVSEAPVTSEPPKSFGRWGSGVKSSFIKNKI